jgi:hypothetical protein
MRIIDPKRDQSEAFYREFALPVEEQDPGIKPLSCSVHRWFQSANICDLYRFRQPEDFVRISSRLLRQQ